MSSPLDTVRAWADAERQGDANSLADLLHPDFLGIGPYGFVLDRDQWTERYRSGDLRHTAFSFTPDTDTRELGGAAIVVGTQEQQSTHQGRRVDGAFRVSLVLVDAPAWRVAGVHLSLRTPPSPPQASAEGRPS